MLRVPPKGASSGHSVRAVSKSSLQLVKEVCLHYVQKCSGKYENNKAAARYVHQMAEEIMSQLGGVANEIKRTRGEPEIYQALLDEWNEHFPSSLGAMGSPKAIAALVASQSREISKLKADLESEKINRETDVTGILRSMDSQLHAYRNSVMNDRRQQKALFDQQLLDYDHKLADLQESFEAERKQLAQSRQHEMTALQKQYEQLLAQAKADTENAKKELKNEMNSVKKKYQIKTEKFREKNAMWESRCNELRSKYNDLAMTLNEEILLDSSDSNDDDLTAEISSSEEEDNGGDDDHQGFAGKDGKFAEDAKKMLQARRERKKLEREAKAKKEKPVRAIRPSSQQQNVDFEKMKQLQENVLVASAQIKRLEKQLDAMDKDNKDRKAELVVLGEKMKDLITERSLHLRYFALF